MSWNILTITMKTKELIYYMRVLKRDLINKSLYKTNNLPHLKKTILIFNVKEHDLKKVTKASLALKMITGKQAKLTISKPFSVSRSLKNESLNVAVTLGSNKSYDFLFSFLNEVYPRSEKSGKVAVAKAISVTIKSNDALKFEELEYNRLFFSELPALTFSLKYKKQLTVVEQKLLLHVL